MKPLYHHNTLTPSNKTEGYLKCLNILDNSEFQRRLTKERQLVYSYIVSAYYFRFDTINSD